MRSKWTSEDKDFVLSNIGKLNYGEMSSLTGKSTMAIHLFIHRHRMSPRCVQKENILFRLLAKKFVNPEYFQPTRDFYETVKIGQKRFWSIYKGEEKITEEEYLRIAAHLGVSLEDAMESRQLSLFEND